MQPYRQQSIQLYNLPLNNSTKRLSEVSIHFFSIQEKLYGKKKEQ